jgi:hypothetical protein
MHERLGSSSLHQRRERGEPKIHALPPQRQKSRDTGSCLCVCPPELTVCCRPVGGRCLLARLLHAEVVVHPPAEVAVCLAKVTVCSPRLSSARWGCCPPAEVAASHHQWERPCPSPQMVLSALSTAAEMKHCGGHAHLCMQMDCFIGVCYCRIGYVSTVDVKLITICLSKNTFHWS